MYHTCQICIMLVRYVSCLSYMYHVCQICIMLARYVSCLSDIYHAYQIYIMLLRYILYLCTFQAYLIKTFNVITVNIV